MVLSAVLKLDAGAFTTPLGTAVQAVQSMLGLSGDLGSRLREAFDAGGALSDLQAQTGESAGTLMLLRQAFEDTGAGADALGQTLAVMRRSLGGISESGEPTAKIFGQLGLNMEELRGMGAEGQLAAIAAAVNGLKDPSQQSAAAMEIFGRSGARMMTFLKDPSAVAAAREALGGLPALMDRSAAAFDAVSDRLGHIRQKGQGLWAGIAEGVLPLADAVTEALDGIDLTGLGQRIGAFLGATVELFRAAPETFGWGDALVLALGEAVNFAVDGFIRLAGVVADVLSSPVAYLQAAFGAAIQKIMEWIGKIPKIGEKLGLKDFKAQGYGELLDEAKAEGNFFSAYADAVKNTPRIELVDVSDEKARLAEVFSAAAASYQGRIETLQREANAAAAAAVEPGTKELRPTKAADGGKTTLADALGKIGGYLGGGTGGMQARLVAVGERTARAAERTADAVAGLSMRPAWGA